MNKALLDTDIWSELLRGKNATVGLRGAAYLAQYEHYTLSTLSVLEVVSGLHRKRREARLQAVLVELRSQEILTLDLVSAEIAGRIEADLIGSGQSIGRIDPMIAAIAIRYDLTLVTGNTSHFERLQTLGYPLKLDDWRAEQIAPGVS